MSYLMTRTIPGVLALFLFLAPALAGEASTNEGKRPADKSEKSTAAQARDTANRIGDDIGKNVGQAASNAIEGFKKRFNTNKPEGK